MNPERHRRINTRAAVSLLVSLALVAVGIVRLLSYSRTNELAELLRSSFLGALAYDPASLAGVRLFKLISTPSVVAGIYLIFRVLNRAHYDPLVDRETNRRRRIDFSSPRLRLLLTSLVTLQWIPLEWVKLTSADFYPNSPLESVYVNAAVLLASQAIAFFGMKHLSFEPLLAENRDLEGKVP